MQTGTTNVFLLFCFIPVPPPTVEITSTPGTRTAGDSLILTCTVTVADESLGQPTIEWMGPGGSIISSGSNIMIGSIAQGSTSSIYTRALEFNLQTSHGGEYTCQSTSSEVTAVDTETLIVQSELKHA